jgi:hypothetical protein
MYAIVFCAVARKESWTPYVLCQKSYVDFVTAAFDVILVGIVPEVDGPLGGAVAGVPAVGVEQPAGVEVLVEVRVDPDPGVEEGTHLGGGRREIGGVDLAAHGLGVRPGQQEADGVAAAERPERGRRFPGVGDRGEGQTVVLLELRLAGDVVAAQDDLAAETVLEPAAVDREGRRGLGVEPEFVSESGGGLGGARRGQEAGDEYQDTEQTCAQS